MLKEADAILLSAQILESGADQPRPERQPHYREITRDRVRERKTAPFGKDLLLQRWIDEGVGDRLLVSAVCKRLQHRRLRGTPSWKAGKTLWHQRICFRNALEAREARHLLDEIRLDRDVESPRGRRDRPIFTAALYLHAERLERARDALGRQ